MFAYTSQNQMIFLMVKQSLYLKICSIPIHREIICCNYTFFVVTVQELLLILSALRLILSDKKWLNPFGNPIAFSAFWHG